VFEKESLFLWGREQVKETVTGKQTNRKDRRRKDRISPGRGDRESEEWPGEGQRERLGVRGGDSEIQR